MPKKDGITRFLDQILPSLAKTYSVTILAPSFTKHFKEETYAGASVIRFPVHKRFQVASYPAVRFFYRKVKEQVKRADIVWIQSAAPLGFMTLLAARRFKKPLLAYIHSHEWEQLTHVLVKSKFIKSLLLRFFARLERYIYNKCDILLVPAKNVAIELAELGIKTRKIIVPLGVDNVHFTPLEDKRKAKRAVHLDPDAMVIGYCGRISREKDVSTLAQAFTNLQGRYPKIQLLIVGDGDRRMVTTIAKKKVYITGFVEDVVPYLQAMDIFVMPSLTETSSLATMEAMAVGLPVISTYVGNIKHYIQDGRNGYLFPRGDAVYLEKKLLRLIENPELRKSFGILARKTMVMRFYWERTVKQIMYVLGRY
ncbi:glycosyltransferase [Candidatus Woesearchaeota archaeon]|nr:glycosyltransferase [Candidatus Woesearchaeota archaeon]